MKISAHTIRLIAILTLACAVLDSAPPLRAAQTAAQKAAVKRAKEVAAAQARAARAAHTQAVRNYELEQRQLRLEAARNRAVYNYNARQNAAARNAYRDNVRAEQATARANARAEQAAARANAAKKAATPVSSATPAGTSAGLDTINTVTRNDTIAPQQVVLADNKQALLPVVISPRAGAEIKTAANDLVAYLDQISGASFQLETSDTPGAIDSGIVLGILAEFPNPTLKGALQTFGNDGVESFAIRTERNRLLLLGASDLGASHAAYRLLHELGCRWFTPDPAWEVVPHTARLTFERNITDRPTILSREIWFESSSPGNGGGDTAYADWQRRNLQAKSFAANAKPNLDDVITTNKAAFDAHPEYYAATRQQNGTMQRDAASRQLELGNPAVRQLIDNYCVNYFRTHRKAEMVSLEPAANASYSVSPESAALGSFSDALFGAANEAARAVEAAYPGKHKMVGLFAYGSHLDPPDFALEPNVYVLLSDIGPSKYSESERDSLWAQRSHNLGYCEYFSNQNGSADNAGAAVWPTNDIDSTQASIKKLSAHGATAISADSAPDWAAYGRGYYVANQLMWNPDADVRAISDDFYQSAFGAGAPAMKRFYERFDPSHNPSPNLQLVNLGSRDIDDAAAATTDRPEISARLALLRRYLGDLRGSLRG